MIKFLPKVFLSKILILKFNLISFYSIFEQVFLNYAQLMEVWDECLCESLEADVKAQVSGCKTQMKSFKFFFGINLDFKVYSITDNLSKTIQGESMSAVESQEVAGLTIKTFESMRSESNADAFYETTKIKAERYKFIEAPSLPRKRKAPNYKSSKQFYIIDGLSPTAEAYHTSNPKEHYRIIYFEVLDAVINVIKERFDQPSFQAYLKLESFLLKVITGSCVEKEKEFLNEKHGDGDVDVELLESEGEVWKTILSDLKPVCFKDILEQ